MHDRMYQNKDTSTLHIIGNSIKCLPENVNMKIYSRQCQHEDV